MRVGLLVTCLVDLFRPSIGFCALSLLQRAGAEVIAPPAQTCCGQPAYNSGDRRAARALALKTLAEFEEFDYVVIPSGSCAGMVSKHYPELFDDDATRQRFTALSARTFELTDFLVNVLHLDSVPGKFTGRLTYHDSCAGLRELAVKRQPRSLMATMEHLKLSEMAGAEVCCGFGGTFSIKFGDIATRMADNKCEQIAATGTGCVALGDLGCMLHIEGRLRRRGDMTTRVLHIAEILAGPDGGSNWNG